LVFVLILVSVANLWAQGVIKDDFKINDDTLDADQQAPDLDVSLLGDFVVAWQDSRDNGPDVFFQRLNASGEAIGANCLVNNQLSGDQRYPSIAFGPSGNFVVAWQDTREGNRNIYAQMFNASGDTAGSNFKVNNDLGTKPQVEPEVDFSAGIVLVWEDERSDAGDIFAQLLDSSCVPQDTNFKVNDDTNGFSQMRSDIASNAEGYFVVVWQDKRQGNYDIYAQRYDPFGTCQGSNFKVNDDPTSSLQNFPKVASDSSGSFVVVWQDQRNGDEDVYAQIFDRQGGKIGANFRVNDDPGDAYQGHPDVAMDQRGDFVVVWVDKRNGDKDIFAQRYDSNLEPGGQNFRVNSDTGSADQSEPAVATDGHSIYFAWTDARNGNSDIFAKIVDWEWTAVTEIRTEENLSSFALWQNFPNPFNSSTTIAFTVHGERKTANSHIPATQKPVNGSQFTVNSPVPTTPKPVDGYWLLVDRPIHTTLRIYNIKGQLVKTLVDADLGLGAYQVIWDGRDRKGTEVATGIYFCRLRIEEYVETKKMLLLK